MSDSERRRRPSWPEVERRGEEKRRSGRDRRRRAARPTRRGEEHHTPADRRQAQRRSGGERRDDAGWEAVPLDAHALVELPSEEILVAAATDARARARAPYSGFHVGAALETAAGIVVTGCNIENASYGLTLCAERVALVKALSDGHSVFTRIVVVADTQMPASPCGPCRQLLWEYCGDIEVILANLERIFARHRLAGLLPEPFDRRQLRGTP